MGTRLQEAKKLVGRLVYIPYSPIQCGKITKDLGMLTPDGYIQAVRCVEWTDLKGETHTKVLNQLNDYEALVEDHKKKYEKHSAIAAQLRGIKCKSNSNQTASTTDQPSP